MYGCMPLLCGFSVQNFIYFLNLHVNKWACQTENCPTVAGELHTKEIVKPQLHPFIQNSILCFVFFRSNLTSIKITCDLWKIQLKFLMLSYWNYLYVATFKKCGRLSACICPSPSYESLKHLSWIFVIYAIEDDIDQTNDIIAAWSKQTHYRDTWRTWKRNYTSLLRSW